MDETVLLVGGGGREHAIARALANSTATLYACADNRNPGITSLTAGFASIKETAVDGVVEYAQQVEATLVIIGPEAPLAAGVVDELESVGIYAFGPRQHDARIETDKAWARDFMTEHDIPGTPEYAIFDDVEDACSEVSATEGDVAVKPTVLTGGKGVRVTGDQLSKEAAKRYMRQSKYETWVVEERLVGEEFTIQALVANGTVRISPAVQDHKRAYKGDEGPNTGGMGSYSDADFTLPFMTEADYEAAVDIIEATVAALPDYRGVLYGQFMLTAQGPKVVEFNARFGDPEAMNTLPIMETDLLDVLTAARDGDELPALSFEPKATVCKYGVPEGYPTDPNAGTRLTFDKQSVSRSTSGMNGDALLFYASVDERSDGLYTTTSRAFAVVGIADKIEAAERITEEAFTNVPEEGIRVRHDIGTPQLVEKRIEHLRKLREP